MKDGLEVTPKGACKGLGQPDGPADASSKMGLEASPGGDVKNGFIDKTSSPQPKIGDSAGKIADSSVPTGTDKQGF